MGGPGDKNNYYSLLDRPFSSIPRRIRSEHESHAVSMVQWYVHDNGIFTTSSVDKMVRIWDTNELCVVEKFKFSGPVYTHSMASSESHCLIAGDGENVMPVYYIHCRT